MALCPTLPTKQAGRHANGDCDCLILQSSA
jgi:hypothetical protein